MDDRSRGVYRGFATLFLIVGAAFVALGLFGATEGDPIPVALLLLAIGAGLHWTVRDRGDGA